MGIDIKDAAHILYGSSINDTMAVKLATLMRVILDERELEASPWKKDAYIGAWWCLASIVYDDLKAIDCAQAYLHMIRRTTDAPLPPRVG